MAERERLRVPAGDSVLEELDRLAAMWGAERTQLAAVALGLGVRLLATPPGWPTGTGVAGSGPAGATAGISVAGRRPAQPVWGPAQPGPARALSGALRASDAAAAAAPDGDEIRTSGTDDLDDEDREALELAVDWREQEHLAAGGSIANPRAWRAAVVAGMLKNTEEINKTLVRREKALERAEKSKPRPPGPDPT